MSEVPLYSLLIFRCKIVPRPPSKRISVAFGLKFGGWRSRLRGLGVQVSFPGVLTLPRWTIVYGRCQAVKVVKHGHVPNLSILEPHTPILDLPPPPSQTPLPEGKENDEATRGAARVLMEILQGSSGTTRGECIYIKIYLYTSAYFKPRACTSPRGFPSKLSGCGPSLKNYTHRGTSPRRNTPLLGPYSRTLPRAIWLSGGGGLFLLSEAPLQTRRIR